MMPVGSGFHAPALTDAGYTVVASAMRGHVVLVRHLVMDRLTRTQVQRLGMIAGRIPGVISADEPLSGAAS